MTGFAMTSLLLWNAGVGAVIAVEAVMEPVVAAMFVAAPKATATVRVFRLAFCALALVVTPVATVTVHSDAAASVAVLAVNVSVAVAVPELVAATVKAVLPHPADMLGVASVPMVKVGSTSAMVSAGLCTRATFSSNVYDTDDSDHVSGVAITNALVASAVATVAVDVVIFTALMSATAFNVTAAVRPLQFASCANLLVVTPLAIVTAHSWYATSVAD